MIFEKKTAFRVEQKLGIYLVSLEILGTLTQNVVFMYMSLLPAFGMDMFDLETTPEPLQVCSWLFQGISENGTTVLKSFYQWSK